MFKSISNFDLIKFNMFILKTFRCHPDKQLNLAYYVNVLIFILLNVISMAVTIMDIFENNHKQPNHINVISTTFIITFQLIPKAALLLLGRNDIITAINNAKRFWAIDQVNIGYENKAKIKSWMKFQRKLLRCYFLTAALGMWPVILTCALYYNPYIKILMLSKNMIIILRVLLCYKVVCTVILNCGCDIFLISTCTQLSVQFQLFAYRVQVIVDENIENNKEELFICIKYHDFLYSYWKSVNNLWALSFLWIFVNSLCSLAVEIIILATVRNLNDVFFNFMVYIALLYQYSVYCMPISDVSETALSVADILYNSNWYLSDLNTMKIIKFIIMRSQKVAAFTAGGLVTIDRRHLTEVFKTSISAYALASVFQDRFSS